ncbi:MAG: single-stranded DNA-binding protein [Patescibacteria group bacterium]|jgi:single-strand DNA-binding protein
MLSVNRATILGNLTRDPELRSTPTGRNVCSFSIATNRRWSGDDGAQQEAVEYHDIVAWGKLAEMVNSMLKKGKPVYVEGRLQTRSWDGQDGIKRYKTEIVADFISALGGREDMSGASSFPSASIKEEKTTTKNKKDEPSEETIDLDSIPF